MKFLEFTIFVKVDNIPVKKKILVRKDTLSGVIQLSNTKSQIIIERKNGDIEEYVVDKNFEEIKGMLDDQTENTEI